MQPALYDATKEIYYSYDNVQSITDKANWIITYGLTGFTVYEAGGDYNNILLNAARAPLGMNLNN